jgi:hypothetical protein
MLLTQFSLISLIAENFEKLRSNVGPNFLDYMQSYILISEMQGLSSRRGEEGLFPVLPTSESLNRPGVAYQLL